VTVLKKVGVLWKKEDKKQNKLLAGNIDFGAIGQVGVLIYPAKKDKPEQPDYVVYLAS